MKIIIFIILVFSVINYGKDFKGAEFRAKASYTYGRFEVNYKTSNREGVLSTFFTYFDGTQSDPWAASKWNEIDLEILGRYNDNVQFNAITPGQQNHARSHFVSFDPSLDFHTYAIEWTPQYVAWFIDGKEVYRQTDSHILTLTHPQKIMMNLWSSAYTNWTGTLNPDALPAFAYYDWVSYYAYTPGSGNYGTDNNFTFSWKDNFDSWDTSKWDKASHTFEGNNCDFIQGNAVFNNGYLVLCLTDNINTGLTDKKSPSLLWARSAGNDITAFFSEETDKTISENISNYAVAGAKINSAVQQKDKRSIKINTDGLNNEDPYNLIVVRMQDTSGNVMQAKAMRILNPKPFNFPVKINIGGNGWQDYLPDQEWTENNEYGYLDGTASFNSFQIGNTDEDEIYKSERYGLAEYKVRVPDGNYNVKLMCAENYFTQNGSRVFDIYVEDSLHSATDIDLYALAGKSNAYNINFSNVTVSDGILDIYFSAKTNNALVDGLVIESAQTGVEQGNVSPEGFELGQNFPNPFNGSTIINYFLPAKDDLNFFIYDILGNLVFEKKIGEKAPGKYEIAWNGKNNAGKYVSSGVYIYKLSGNINEAVKKLVLLY